jgi:hypothetical protein
MPEIRKDPANGWPLLKPGPTVDRIVRSKAIKSQVAELWVAQRTIEK